MASTLLVDGPEGLTATVELFADGDETIANTGGDTLTESVTRAGYYTAAIAESLSGIYGVNIISGGNLIGQKIAYFTGTNGETVKCTERSHVNNTGLNSIVCTEPAAVPTYSNNIISIIAWLFALSAHKLKQTSSLLTLRNLADSSDTSTSTTSDNGTTFTRGKFQ